MVTTILTFLFLITSIASGLFGTLFWSKRWRREREFLNVSIKDANLLPPRGYYEHLQESKRAQDSIKKNPKQIREIVLRNPELLHYMLDQPNEQLAQLDKKERTMIKMARPVRHHIIAFLKALEEI